MPEFDVNGNLPAGVYECTWEDFENRFGTNPHRKRLLEGMKRAIDSLRNAGCRRVYIDGSFVTAKEYPSDFDGCWDATNVTAGLLDPILLSFGQGQYAQKAKYYGELFPNIVEKGSGMLFLDFFQNDKNTGKPKGIVSLELGWVK